MAFKYAAFVYLGPSLKISRGQAGGNFWDSGSESQTLQKSELAI